MMINRDSQTHELCFHQKIPSHEAVIHHFGDAISTEDKEVMLKTVKTMKSEGATHHKIKSYVDQTFSDFGVDLPHRSQHQRHSSRGQGRELEQVIQDPGARLDKGLRHEIIQLIKTMKGEGAKFESVKEAVDAKLTDHGVTDPPPPGSLFRVIG